MFGAILVAALTLCYAPTNAMAVESEPNLTEAQSAMVIDAQGNVLYEKNPDEEINMASVTKVMTAVVALESGVSLDTVCNLSAPALDENAMVAGYQSGDTSTLRDLLRAALVYSANDGAYEVAVAVAGSEDDFVQMMNDKAAELGMNNTHFENSHGLDAEGHHSTVHDLTILARYAMTKHPFIADTVRQTEVTVPIGENNVTLPTVDTLLYSYPGLLGIKTGTGNHVTAFLGCARRNGVTLYTSVLGCQTKEGRFTDTASLLDWAFGTYDAHSYASPASVRGVARLPITSPSLASFLLIRMPLGSPGLTGETSLANASFHGIVSLSLGIQSRCVSGHKASISCQRAHTLRATSFATP